MKIKSLSDIFIITILSSSTSSESYETNLIYSDFIFLRTKN